MFTSILTSISTGGWMVRTGVWCSSSAEVFRAVGADGETEERRARERDSPQSSEGEIESLIKENTHYWLYIQIQIIRSVGQINEFITHEELMRYVCRSNDSLISSLTVNSLTNLIIQWVIDWFTDQCIHLLANTHRFIG